MLRHLVLVAALDEMFRGGASGGAAAGIERYEFLFFGDPRDDQYVTADSGAFRLDDIQHGGGGHRCIKRVAASFEDLQPGLGGERLAHGDYTVAGQNFRAGLLRKPTAGAVAANGVEGLRGRRASG